SPSSTPHHYTTLFRSQTSYQPQLGAIVQGAILRRGTKAYGVVVRRTLYGHSRTGDAFTRACHFELIRGRHRQSADGVRGRLSSGTDAARWDDLWKDGRGACAPCK